MADTSELYEIGEVSETRLDRIGSRVSDFIGLFAPVTAMQMDFARKTRQSLRGYDAAKPNRFTKNKIISDGSANQELLFNGALSKIRKYSRDLCRNSAIVRSLKKALSAHIVGTGVTLQARATNSDGKAIPEFNKQVERYWKIYEKQCDLRGKKSFSQFMRQAVDQFVETGEYIIHKVNRTGSGVVDLKLESIDSDLLNHNVNTENTIGGVEFDGDMRATGYYFAKASDLIYQADVGSLVNFKRVDAKEIIHTYLEDRPGQLRGEPWLAPCLPMIWSAHRSLEAELAAIEVQACFGVIYKSGTGGIGKKFSGSQTGTTDSNGNAMAKLAPASIIQLTNAEDITIVDPKRPGNTLTPFMDKIIEIVSASLGISYAKTTKDYSKGNFSSQRMCEHDDRRHLSPIQNFITDSIIRIIYADFVDQLVISGKVKARNYFENRDFYLQSDWTFQPYDYIQPLDDANADRVMLDNKTTTFKDYFSKEGKDWEEEFAQQALEKKTAEDLGIIIYQSEMPSKTIGITAAAQGSISTDKKIDDLISLGAK